MTEDVQWQCLAGPAALYGPHAALPQCQSVTQDLKMRCQPQKMACFPSLCPSLYALFINEISKCSLVLASKMSCLEMNWKNAFPVRNVALFPSSRC